MPYPLLGRRQLLVGAGAAALALAACSGDGRSSSGPTTTAARGGRRRDPGRIVVIGQDDEVADVLALGLTPVAGGANVPMSGFQGMGDLDAAGVEVLDLFAIDAEDVLNLRPDLVVTTAFFADEAGAAIDQVGEVVVIDDQLSPADRLRALGDELDRRAEADEAIAALDAAVAASRAALEGREVSVAAVYSGPSVAAFADEPGAFASTLLAAGCTLRPGPGTPGLDQMGRIYLSRELLDVLSAPDLVLLQSDLVDGEAAARAEIEDDGLWRDLPAVVAGRVHVLDRLGYSGVPGRTRLADDLVAALGSP